MTSRSFQSAFTLIELLVTLSILTALATAAALSTAGLRERELTARTVRQGEALCAALERDEGLSFVSDLGFTPDNLGSLVALRQATYDPGLSIEEDGTVAASGITVRLPFFATCTAPLLQTNSLIAAETALVLTNGLGNVHLGAGWRGPYVTEKFSFKSDAEPCLADPWGGAWEVEMTNGIVTVTSRGRDGAVDEGAADWSDCDRSFSTRPVSASTLVVTVKLPAGLSYETAGSATLSLYEPHLDLPKTGVWREGSMTLQSRMASASVTGAETSITFENCSAGIRVLWAYVTIGTDVYTAAPRLVGIRAGNTMVELTLQGR